MAKKLDLSLSELCNIAIAINKNTIANRSKTKEEKIPTDKFLRDNFKINRKDFSTSIKGTGIRYNPSEFKYDIPQENYNNKTNIIEPKKNIKAMQEPKEDKNNIQVIQKPKEDKNNIEVLHQIKNILPIILEMIDWYKENNISPTELNLNHDELKGAIRSHSLKCYETVYISFNKLCSKKYKGYKKQDLVSLALLDFVKKYN